MAVEAVRDNIQLVSSNEASASVSSFPGLDIALITHDGKSKSADHQDVPLAIPSKVVEIFDTEPAMEELDFFLRKLEIGYGETKQVCLNREDGGYIEKEVVGIEAFDIQELQREVSAASYQREFGLYRRTAASVKEWVVPTRMHVLGHDMDVGTPHGGTRGDETILFADVVLTVGIGSRIRLHTPGSFYFAMRRNQYEQKRGELEHLSKVDATLNNLRVDVEDYFEGEGNHPYQRIEDIPLFESFSAKAG